MGRNLKDANFIATTALPAAGASNNSNVFDLGAGNFLPEEIELQISLPATPNLADTKNVTLTIQDSADNVTFAAITGLATVVATGAGGVGAAAKTETIRLPSTTRQYLRLNQAVDAVGGDSTGVSTTFQLLF